MSVQGFRKLILKWYAKNRRDLPWRNTDDPYKILVSELMLQQTQISRVIPKYHQFLREFPDVQTLAKANDRRLLKVWTGLGYWRRAKFLKETAQKVLQEYGGKFPKEPALLDTFPGIGEYTARALACFAFGNREAFLDTNIRRVYLHFFFERRKDVEDREVLDVAEKALPKKNLREWHYALFDYGALVLKDKRINRRSRAYHKQSKFEGSFRSFRTKVIRFLLSSPKQRISSKILRAFLEKELGSQKSSYSADEIIDALSKDRLVKKTGDCYFI